MVNPIVVAFKFMLMYDHYDFVLETKKGKKWKERDQEGIQCHNKHNSASNLENK